MTSGRKKIYGILGLISLIFSFSSICVIYIIDIPMYNNQLVNFQVDNGDNLIGTYINGNRNAGIIILEGFGSDQMAMKSIGSEFASYGFHIFTFDFSGHGISPGTIFFDNAATDRFAKQVIKAKEVFKSISGLLDSQIILIGHSMGARVALQSATFDTNNVSGLILIGVQVNLDVNIQAGFFTGVSDADLDWVNNLSSSNPPTDIAIISGTFDDILPPMSATLLYEKLGGSSSNYTRNLRIFDFLFHNYEIFSPAVISYSLNWALIDLGLDPNPNYIAVFSVIRKIIWYIASITIFISLVSASKYMKEKKTKSQNTPSQISILNPRKYLMFKGIFWLLAIPITLGIISLLFIIPIGVPIFSLVYVGFIGGYGILMLILYRYNKVPGSKGKLKLNFKWKSKASAKNLLISIGLIVVSTLIATLFANSGIFLVFALNTRFIWLILLSLLAMPGFFISQKELEYLKTSYPTAKKSQLGLTVIGFVPFIAVTIFFSFLGSLSGMIGSINGLIILAYVVLSGSLVKKLSNNIPLTVIFQSILIQLLVLPQGSLFATF
jgi:hypothetical protein